MKKKELLLSVAVFGAVAAINSGALAASPGPGYSWTGCYLGVNAGGSWGHAHVDSSATGLASLGLPTANSASLNPDGFIGGGQVGCNWQNTNWVWGVETDFQGSAERASRTSSVPFATTEGPSGNVTQNLEARIQWFGTLRARAGVLITPTVLLYATGGLAYGDVKVTDTITVSGVGSSAFSSSSTRAGWTVGAGVEGMIPTAPSWTWKVEYLYMDLGTTSGSGTDPLGGSVAWSAHFTDNILRVGLNYRFSP